MAVSHLSEDEQTLIEVLREIALEKVAPRAAEIDHTAQFPWDMKELLAQQDILAMPFPTEYGGIGASELAILMAIEELSRHCNDCPHPMCAATWVTSNFVGRYRRAKAQIFSFSGEW